MYEIKLALAVPILLYMSYLDIKHRAINDRSWITLLAVGTLFFVGEIINNPTQLRATMFAFSLFSVMILGASLYLTGLLPSGDLLPLIGIATVTYDILPLPFFAFILLGGAMLSLPYSLIQIKTQKKTDIPMLVPITVSYVLCIALNPL